MAHVSFRLVVLLPLLFSSAALAHHSYVSVYDNKKVITLKGVITEVRFGNPHIFVSLDVPGRGSWKIETESVAKVTAKGLSAKQLQEGTKVTVQGWPARDGSAALGLKSIALPGGKTIVIRNTAR